MLIPEGSVPVSCCLGSLVGGVSFVVFLVVWMDPGTSSKG